MSTLFDLDEGFSEEDYVLSWFDESFPAVYVPPSPITVFGDLLLTYYSGASTSYTPGAWALDPANFLIGSNFVQATSGKRPLLGKMPNGKSDALNFDGIDDILTGGANITVPGTTTSVIYFTMFRTSNPLQTATIFSSNPTGGDTNTALVYESGVLALFDSSLSSPIGVATPNTGAGGWADGNWHIVIVIVSCVSGIPTALFVDNAASLSQRNADFSVQPSYAVNGLSFGNNWAGTAPFDGDLATFGIACSTYVSYVFLSEYTASLIGALTQEFLSPTPISVLWSIPENIASDGSLWLFFLNNYLYQEDNSTWFSSGFGVEGYEELQSGMVGAFGDSSLFGFDEGFAELGDLETWFDESLGFLLARDPRPIPVLTTNSDFLLKFDGVDDYLISIDGGSGQPAGGYRLTFGVFRFDGGTPATPQSILTGGSFWFLYVDNPGLLFIENGTGSIFSDVNVCDGRLHTFILLEDTVDNIVHLYIDKVLQSTTCNDHSVPTLDSPYILYGSLLQAFWAQNITYTPGSKIVWIDDFNGYSLEDDNSATPDLLPRLGLTPAGVTCLDMRTNTDPSQFLVSNITFAPGGTDAHIFGCVFIADYTAYVDTSFNLIWSFNNGGTAIVQLFLSRSGTSLSLGVYANGTGFLLGPVTHTDSGWHTILISFNSDIVARLDVDGVDIDTLHPAAGTIDLSSVTSVLVCGGAHSPFMHAAFGFAYRTSSNWASSDLVFINNVLEEYIPTTPPPFESNITVGSLLGVDNFFNGVIGALGVTWSAQFPDEDDVIFPLADALSRYSLGSEIDIAAVVASLFTRALTPRAASKFPAFEQMTSPIIPVRSPLPFPGFDGGIFPEKTTSRRYPLSAQQTIGDPKTDQSFLFETVYPPTTSRLASLTANQLHSVFMTLVQVLLVVGDISSSESVSSPTINQNIGAAGDIISAETVDGLLQLILNVLTSSISSAEAFGSPQLNLNILTADLASSENIPSPELDENLVLVGDIASTESLPSPQLNENVSSAGDVATSETFGINVVGSGISTSDIPSLETVSNPQLNENVAPSDVSSAETLGVPELDLNISSGDLASSEVVPSIVLSTGAVTVSPSDILSAENVPNPQLAEGIVSVGDIATNEAIPSQTIIPGPVSITQTAEIPSAEAVATPALVGNISPSDIASAEATSSPQLNETIESVGDVSSGETIPGPIVGPVIFPTSITSSEQLDSPTIVPAITPTSVTSSESVSSPQLNENILSTGILSGEVVPSPQLDENVLPSSVSSSESVSLPLVTTLTSILPFSVTTQENVTSPVITPGPVQVTTLGIGSSESVLSPELDLNITPSSILSLEAIGVLGVSYTLQPVSIISQEVVSDLSLNQTLHVLGIISDEDVPPPSVFLHIQFIFAGDIASDEAFGPPIVVLVIVSTATTTLSIDGPTLHRKISVGPSISVIKKT